VGKFSKEHAQQCLVRGVEREKAFIVIGRDRPEQSLRAS
jgi:hypothetical protein